jgi:elongation factor P--(R)-beta-lysine ligase
MASRLGISAPASIVTLEDRDGWLDLLLVERIEPHLGIRQPVILYDYPASQAALAQIRAENPPVAERFELYFRGVELANGYHELGDADELRRRNRRTNELRKADGKVPLPEASRLLAAMESGLPSCTGVALGFDRLVMLACGAKEIAEVIAFPVGRA